MSYVSNYGESGPIKVSNTWIREITKTVPDEVTKDNELRSIGSYLGFSYKREGSIGDYRKLLAGSPPIGVYTDGNNKTHYYAPDNAVVTVGWLSFVLSGYEIPSGGMFDPDAYAKVEDVRVIEAKVALFEEQIKQLQLDNTNIINRVSNSESQIKLLQTDLEDLESRVKTNEDDIDDIEYTLENLWLTGLTIQCGW